MYYNLLDHFRGVAKMVYFSLDKVFAIALTECVRTNKIVIGSILRLNKIEM